MRHLERTGCRTGIIALIILVGMGALEVWQRIGG